MLAVAIRGEQSANGRGAIAQIFGRVERVAGHAGVDAGIDTEAITGAVEASICEVAWDIESSRGGVHVALLSRGVCNGNVLKTVALRE